MYQKKWRSSKDPLERAWEVRWSIFSTERGRSEGSAQGSWSMQGRYFAEDQVEVEHFEHGTLNVYRMRTSRVGPLSDFREDTVFWIVSHLVILVKSLKIGLTSPRVGMMRRCWVGIDLHVMLDHWFDVKRRFFYIYIYIWKIAYIFIFNYKTF